jgi:hypothetical protein
MPLNCLLSTPDGKTDILNVSAFSSGTNTPIAGQPVTQSETAFSLNLPAGSYSVVIVTGSLAKAKPVFMVEDCAGQTPLASITPPANAGHFSVVVV